MKRLIGKKASLETKEIIEFGLAAGVIVLLIILLVALISPYFNKNKETAESYFNTLKEQIKVADRGGVGEFLMWQEVNNVEFYLVYFGDEFRYESNGVLFNSIGKNKNHICICYGAVSDMRCESCENLNSEALYCNTKTGWVKPSGVSLFIQKKSGVYNFCETK